MPRLAAALLALMLATASQAQPKPGLEATLHLHCVWGVPPAEQIRAYYWMPALARRNADPDCIARQPLAGPFAVRSVSLRYDAEGDFDIVRLEFDLAARIALEKATRAHLRSVVAVVAGGRILGTMFLTGVFNDPHLPVYVTEKGAGIQLLTELRQRLPAK
jgi:hypothetical protein